MGSDHLGHFEQLVLLATLSLGEDAHTTAILAEVEGRTGRGTSHAAVYKALRRMERKELVRSWLGEPTPERGGRAKRYFEVCPETMPLLQEARAALLSMWDAVEST